MKRNKLIYCMIAAGALLVASCSDFSDYNEVNSTGSAESNLTLMENISSNSSLSEFAALLEQTGFDSDLSAATFYTVWAPANGTFDYDSIAALDSATLVDRFIYNHVANYNYPVSGSDEVRVYMLSGKAFSMENSYLGDIAMTDINLPSVNGVMHILDGYEEFRPNIYEYIFDSESDSLAAYFDYFETLTFDASQSVVGEIDDLGRQLYSDSVFVEENTLIKLLNASIDDEDSTYTILIPTNEAYAASYEQIKEYYAYPSGGSISYYPLSSTGVGSSISVDVDADYQTDSLARLSLAQNLIYSHDDWYNGWAPDVEDGCEIWQTDTIRTTNRVKISNAEEVISYTVGDAVELSNGYARMIDSLAVHPWDSWAPELEVDLSRTDNYPLYNSCNVTYTTINDYNWNTDAGDYVSGYLKVDSLSQSGQPDVYFILDGVKSTTYNLYVVFLPWNMEKGTSHPERLIRFDATVCYYGSSGLTTSSTDYLLTDSSMLGKVDTFFVMQVTFPYCYTALDDDDAAPYLELRIRRSYYNSTQRNYGNTMRIGGIILRPVEYDEYLDSLAATDEEDEEEEESSDDE